MQIKVNVEDIFGEHDEKFRQEVLRAFKMEVPHHVILHFPQALADKMEEVRKVANDMHLTVIRFGISLSESAERPKIEVFDKHDTLIPITQYEEAGIRDTLSEFTLEYTWIYQAFRAHFHYVTSWWEVSFKTEHFNP